MKEIGRLALRQEGDLWVAYYAIPNSMEGAVFLGSIQIRFVYDQTRKEIFMTLMREAVADLIEETTGERPLWKEPKEAPEHERL